MLGRGRVGEDAPP
jgi:hypothetical protein